MVFQVNISILILSSIAVSNVPGQIGNVTVSVDGPNNVVGNNLGLALVAPGGRIAVEDIEHDRSPGMALGDLLNLARVGGRVRTPAAPSCSPATACR